jgi:hypothetical protein
MTTILDDRSILSALQDATEAAVLASIKPDLPVKYLGRSWTPPNDQKWLEVIFIPNNPSDFWGNEQTYMGMYRLILHWPNDDSGAYEPIDVLASVAGYFSKDRRLQNVSICETPAFGGVLEEGAENLYPASMRYQSFRA